MKPSATSKIDTSSLLKARRDRNLQANIRHNAILKSRSTALLNLASAPAPAPPLTPTPVPVVSIPQKRPKTGEKETQGASSPCSSSSPQLQGSPRSRSSSALAHTTRANSARSAATATTTTATATASGTGECSSSSSMNSPKRKSSLSLKAALSTDDAKYDAHLVRLQRFTKKATALQKTTSQKNEWLNELRSLNSSSTGMGEELTSLLEVLLMHSASDQETEMLYHSLSDTLCPSAAEATAAAGEAADRAGGGGGGGGGGGAGAGAGGGAAYELMAYASALQSDRMQYQNVLLSQLADIKDMLVMTKKAALASQVVTEGEAGAGAEAEGLAGTDEEEAQQPKNTAHCIFADLLIQAKTNMFNQWSNLSNEYDTLKFDVDNAAKSISIMMSVDRRASQNESVTRELTVLPEDDASVILYMDEWLARIKMLDDSWGKELLAFAEENKETTAKYKNDTAYVQPSVTSADAPAIALANAATFDNNGNTNNKTANEVEGEGDAGVDDTATVGLSAGDHMTFVKIARRAITAGQSRKQVLAQWELLLPHVPHSQLILHDTWYAARRLVAKRRKAASLKYDASRGALLNDAKAALENYRLEHRNQLKLQNELQAQEGTRQALHRHLDLLRSNRLALQAKLDSQAAAEAHLKHAQAEAEHLKLTREYEFKKEQVSLFLKAKEDLARAHLEQQKLLLDQEAQYFHAQVEANRSKVQARQEQLQEKLDKGKEREAALAAREEKKMQFLMELASQVPYWDAIQNATAKLDHVTAAVEAQKYLGFEEQARGHKTSTGYADKQIIGDARFRLATALREAGVASSKAAAIAVHEYFPRPHLAMHGIMSRANTIF